MELAFSLKLCMSESYIAGKATMNFSKRFCISFMKRFFGAIGALSVISLRSDRPGGYLYRIELDRFAGCTLNLR